MSVRVPRSGFAVACSQPLAREAHRANASSPVGKKDTGVASRLGSSRAISGQWNTAALGLRRASLARKRVPFVSRGVRASSSASSSEPPSTPSADLSQSGPSSFTMLAGATGLLLTTVLLATFLTGSTMVSLKQGFISAFSIIFVSELGDKTFFIAALLAMRRGRTLVFAASVVALATMTVISVGLGVVFQQVPSALATDLPIGQYAGAALLVYFGIRNIRDALEATPASEAQEGEEVSGELADAEEMYNNAKVGSTNKGSWGIMAEAFTLVFMAEWGDRSMLATIALGVAQNPVAVATGAVAGHALATFIAVIGGAFLAKYISERVVGLIGGGLFIVFALATVIFGF
eukprot:CAMPEP_0118927830 /NCGR_PEP_ID=MMETSP1169-20130426/5218_1 /TAXON_ID=36882 /ORGANISM="Pyramimonas obovata, Strain CCMP722" /LENGTH=347 /DNA_ID=CAMNT_0006869677 /DNA_START=116 /DNA_END=1159 /DNA_ORIENTATION=+